jgi:hypothetical protein
MALVGEERREFQRLPLQSPLAANLGGMAVTILEIGVLGARVRHDAKPAQQYETLKFKFGDVDIALKSELVRTTQDGKESGLRFLAAVDESGDRLRDMLANLITREFEVRRKTGVNSMPASTVDGDKTVRGKDAAFLCYRLEGEKWHKRRVFLPEQPNVGFTVARSEDSDEMQRLCRIYQASDDEGRRLIRLFAELSVSDALQIPPAM